MLLISNKKKRLILPNMISLEIDYKEWFAESWSIYEQLHKIFCYIVIVTNFWTQIEHFSAERLGRVDTLIFLLTHKDNALLLIKDQLTQQSDQLLKRDLGYCSNSIGLNYHARYI